MIEKKSLMMALKRALQSGSFNFANQQATEIPAQLMRLDSLNFEDQNWWQCNPLSKLDFSNNQIRIIPAEISSLSDIQVLRIKNNILKQIPSSLFTMPILKLLDLSKNKLVILPTQLSMAPSLVQLNLSENMLEQIPDLHHLKNLQILYLEHNHLKILPSLSFNLKKLEVSNNKITIIHRISFLTCNCLQYLNLSKNMIEIIQQEAFSHVNNLISLELNQNKLSNFNQMPNSIKLDTISLSYNKLTSFTSFNKCPNLAILILADNRLKSISNDIIKLTKLKTLDISNNDLSDLPCQIGFINSLVRIQLQGNPLKSIRQNIRTGGTNIIKNYLKDRIDPQRKKQLENIIKGTISNQLNEKQYWQKLINQFNQNGQLILRKLQLKQIDDIIYFKNFKGLNFSNNKLCNLSQKIIQLTNLKYLIVNYNCIEKLPANLGLLPHLDNIQATNNSLVSFGDYNHHLNSYLSLKSLNLSNNKFKQIPNPILSLPKLRILQLAFNTLTDIQCLWNYECLPYLQILDVSNNQITGISQSVLNKSSLNYLNLQNNNCKNLPTVLGFMKLTGLKIDGNPLKQIKRIVIDKGTTAIMDFLRTKHIGQIPELREPKKIEQVPQMIPQKPNYPYETQPILKQLQQQEQQSKNNVDVQKKIQQIQQQINQIKMQLQNNMSMNNMQKNEKKKKMQALMIERNKLSK